MAKTKWVFAFVLVILTLNLVACLNISKIQDVNQVTAKDETKKEIKTLRPSDAAKAAAKVDDSGAPYFLVYKYDKSNYLVSAYQSQQGAGNYSGASEVYLVNKTSGKVQKNADIDFSKVNFSKYITVYSKLSKKIIE